MCAAAMSSLDTTINSLAMITVRDFYLHFRPQASDRRQLLLGRIASGGWGLLGMAAGLLMLAGVERAYYFGATVSSFIGGGILGLFLLGMFVRRAHTRGVWIGVFTGISISVWGGADTLLEMLGASSGFTESVRFPWHPWMIMGLGNIASFTVGWLASILLPDRTRATSVAGAQ
jgi:Na+/proline symporter